MNPIGHIVATVSIPVYAGDQLRHGRVRARWFRFEAPGRTAAGNVGICTRPVQLLSQEFIPEVQRVAEFDCPTLPPPVSPGMSTECQTCQEVREEEAKP